MKAGRKYNLKFERPNPHQTRIFCPKNYFLKVKENTFSDKQKLKEFVASSLVL